MKFIEISLSIIAFIFIISSILANSRCYKYYLKYYKRLQNLKFYESNGLVYSLDRDFIWFSKINEFKLIDDIYIFNHLPSYVDPYTLYWLIKYKRYANKNLRHLLNDKQL